MASSFHGIIKKLKIMENANPYTDKLHPWSSHYQIAKLLAELPPGSRILDVGAGSGTLARLCHDRGYIMRAIEPNTDWLVNSRDLYTDVYEGTVESAPDEYIASNDAVVCGDVLEHLVDPGKQLERLVKTQPKKCIFIISVPNIANIWIRLQLLLGQFTYSDRGILDRTHLHFYTKSSFTALIHCSGLMSENLLATPIPLDLISPFFDQNPLGKSIYYLISRLSKYWPTLFGYQWVAKAMRTDS